ncbi:MAG: IS110 family transposase [Victivallales bacterium]|nr:IS110 family transposase [Victivallales bacterium]
MAETAKEEAPLLWIGIDVSKKTFTAAARLPWEEKAVYPKGGVEFENNRSGARMLCKWIEELEKDSCGTFGVAMEATGVYSLRLYDNLKKCRPELHVAICNPLSVSYYMLSLGTNKTDKADAAVIAGFATHRRPARHTELSKDQAELRRLARDRAFLVDSRTEYKNRLESERNPVSRRRINNVMATINEQISDIDAEIEKYLATEASSECGSEIGLMQTVPGIGRLSAAIIYGELGSLAGYTRKQLSAMSGVCPTTRQSGTSLHKGGLSRRGSKWLRRILYLDSWQAILRSRTMAAFHDRMLSKPDSSKMSARVACMRKLLLVLRGIVVSGKPFDPNHVSVRPASLDKKQKNPEKSEVGA